MVESLKKRAKTKLYLHIVNQKQTAVRTMQIMSLIVSIVTIAAIIIYHGCYLRASVINFIRGLVYFSLAFYIVKYFVLMFYSLHKIEYIKKSWFECIIIAVLLLHFILYWFFGWDLFNFKQYENAYILCIQIYFLVIMLIELSKASTFIGNMNLSPPVLLMSSFFILIVIGTILLVLPRMTTHHISFTDALFTATSASCVTGLTVLSTAHDFTLQGQVVIMILMQLGGMSILSFATFFTTFLSRSFVGLRYQYLVKDMLSANRLSDSFSLLRQIILATFIIEASGVLMFYMYWRTTGFFDGTGTTFFYSLFHAVSAFNNAGFALWDASFNDAQICNSFFPQTIIMILVFLGGIGFVTISEFFNPAIIRERKKYRWKQLSPGTKIVLLTTFGIIIVGTLMFFTLEYNHSLAAKNTLIDKIFASMFQIISGRTAGFNIIDVNAISIPGMLLVMVIIFIGASPGSTGGGIKTTTFFVLIKSVMATIKGKQHIEFDKKTIPFSLVDKAYTIVVLSVGIIFTSVFVLALVEPETNLINIMFESISAFTTCGLSTNCQADFSNLGKLVLIVDMYIGRIGTLTMAYALGQRNKESRHTYPETYFMIG
jgi:potassium uptake TrkH family protein